MQIVIDVEKLVTSHLQTTSETCHSPSIEHSAFFLQLHFGL